MGFEWRHRNRRAGGDHPGALIPLRRIASAQMRFFLKPHDRTKTVKRSAPEAEVCASSFSLVSVGARCEDLRPLPVLVC